MNELTPGSFPEAAINAAKNVQTPAAERHVCTTPTPPIPLQGSLYCQIRFTNLLLTLVISRKSVPIGPLMPDDRVWELIVGHLETAILTLARFLALR